MTSVTCRGCGLIQFASAPRCKKCGAELAQQQAAAAVPPGTINLIGDGGLPDGVKGALLFLTACVVCALSIYWVKPYLPGGRYLVIFFLPFAFLGYLAGLIVTNLANAVFKGLTPDRQR